MLWNPADSASVSKKNINSVKRWELNMNVNANIQEERKPTEASSTPGFIVSELSSTKVSRKKKLLEIFFLVLALTIIWAVLSLPLVLYYTPLSQVSYINTQELVIDRILPQKYLTLVIQCLQKTEEQLDDTDHINGKNFLN